ncbi:hypothetical protein ACO2Q3_12650 [Caulobacter sp. KR2-114]|uniref:hypothetical protein n=1 Tax=Caulobacter sp. KR2-114 TaxID=3400912 RepID=UPI003C0A68C4
MTLAVSAERATHADYEKTRAEYALAGDRLAAVQALLGASNTGRVRWQLASENGPVEVIAEPEGLKLSPKNPGEGLSALNARLQVKDEAHLTSALAALASDNSAEAIEAADDSALWRLCARTFLSPHGTAASVARAPTAAPRPGPINWRLGQLWRLRLTDADGRTEDTVIRFTGAPGHPIAVAERQFTHSGPMGERCDFAA